MAQTVEIASAEKEILHGCLKGDSRSQEALYRKFASRMMSVCLRYASNRPSAEDLLQEGFIRVFRSIRDYRAEGSLEGWIRRIMVRTALEQFRKEVRFFQVSEIEAARATAADEQILSGMNSAEILDAIMKLPAGYRTVLNLYVIEGYNHREIGEMLGITEGTSKSQLSRAREMLKEKLVDYRERRMENA